jgi:hypothetical protein
MSNLESPDVTALFGISAEFEFVWEWCVGNGTNVNSYFEEVAASQCTLHSLSDVVLLFTLLILGQLCGSVFQRGSSWTPRGRYRGSPGHQQVRSQATNEQHGV